MFKEWQISWRKTLFSKCRLLCRAYLTALKEKLPLFEFLEQFLGKEHGMFTGWDFYNIRIYPGGDPDLFFTEYDGRGVVAQSGYQYRQKYITMFRVSDGRISHWREYLNPIPLQEAMNSGRVGEMSGVAMVGT